MTTGWDAINKAAEYQQRRIMEAIGRHVSHTLLARSMDVGLARAGYDHVIRTESFDAGRAEAVKDSAERVEQLESENRRLHAVLAKAHADQGVLRLYARAADQAFLGTGSLLPNFLRLGDCKAEGITRLAEAYLDLRERHAVERAAHAKAAAKAEVLAAALVDSDKMRLDYRDERDRLAKFKAFVHKRLDEAGVPADPPGEHRDRGCRIGQRLAWCEQAMANANPFRALQSAQFDAVVKERDELAKAGQRVADRAAEHGVDSNALNELRRIVAQHLPVRKPMWEETAVDRVTREHNEEAARSAREYRPQDVVEGGPAG